MDAETGPDPEEKSATRAFLPEGELAAEGDGKYDMGRDALFGVESIFDMGRELKHQAGGFPINTANAQIELAADAEAVPDMIVKGIIEGELCIRGGGGTDADTHCRAKGVVVRLPFDGMSLYRRLAEEKGQGD